MTNIDSILKSRDITLSAKVHVVKLWFLPIVMNRYESWTIKKAECWRTDAFEYAIYVGHSFSSKEQASFKFVTAVTIHSDFRAQENKICHCFYFYPFYEYTPWSDGTRCHDLIFFNVYAVYIKRNAKLDEAESRMKISGWNISNLRYADDTTLMAESEKELKSLLMKVKEESVKVGLKLNI